MKKLNKRKIKWIVREMDKRDIGAHTIAKIQDITPRHVRRVYKKYKDVKDPKLLPCGRKPREITKEEREAVVKTYKEYLVGATMIEQILDEKGIHINHNRIHRILLEEGLAKQEKKKKKRRKWVRYERKHSLSLVHSDWFEFKRWKCILIEDDASRFITGYGKFKHAMSENGIKVFKKSLRWGIPKQFHSDNGSVFRANEQEGKKKGEARFEKVVREAGIHQIFTRVKHPQGNGKMEKLIGTIKSLWNKLGSFEKAVKHYNYKKPHWSLNNGKLRTPYQAFLDKMRKK
jgi:putative transposase